MSNYTYKIKDGFSFGEDLLKSLEQFFDEYGCDPDSDSPITITSTYRNGESYTCCILDEGVSEFQYRLEKFKEGIDVSGEILKYEEDYGGGGCGDEYWFVFSVERDGVKRYFKWDGCWASYDGGYYESLFEVNPKEVVAIVWEKAK